MAQRRGRNEGTIYQRKSDGKWCSVVELERVKGKRRRRVVYGATKREVQEKLKALHRDQVSGINITPQHQTVAQFLEQWLEQIVAHRNRVRTYDRYAGDVRRHIIPHIGRRRLASLAPEHVQAMINALAKEGLKENTLRNIRAALRRALNVAIRYAYVHRNVATLVDIPKDAEAFKIKPLNQAQAKRLLEELIGHRLEVLFRIALSLGLRRGEVCGLLWADVDFDRKTLRVTGSLQRQRSDGGPTKTRVERSKTKNDVSLRTIAIPDVLLRLLKAHKIRQESEFGACELVFVSEKGTALEPHNVVRTFKATLKRAELPNIRFHDLRHSCATLLIAQGVHLSVIKDVLGHAQISTTADIYGHVLPQTQRDALQGLDELFPAENDDDSEG